MQIVQLNVAGRDIVPPISLDRRRRRLSQAIGRHVDSSRPFMVAVQTKEDRERPLGELWVARGWKVPPVKDEAGRTITPGVCKTWPRRYLGKDDTVVVVYLPLGGGGASTGGSRSKSPLAIVAGIAGLALASLAGPIGAGIAGAFFSGSTLAATPSHGRMLIGSTALATIMRNRSKTN